MYSFAYLGKGMAGTAMPAMAEWPQIMGEVILPIHLSTENISLEVRLVIYTVQSCIVLLVRSFL